MYHIFTFFYEKKLEFFHNRSYVAGLCFFRKKVNNVSDFYFFSEKKLEIFHNRSYVAGFTFFGEKVNSVSDFLKKILQK